MLKIKDDIDLKELEKFGFAYREHYKNYIKLHSNKDYEDYVDNYIQIDKNRVLRAYTRILNGHDTEYCDKSQTNIKDEFLDTIYGLIQAGLVEKIEWKK